MKISNNKTNGNTANNKVNHNCSSNKMNKSYSNKAPTTKIDFNSLHAHSNTTASVQSNALNDRIKNKSYSSFDNDLASDNLENDFTYADLQDL